MVAVFGATIVYSSASPTSPKVMWGRAVEIRGLSATSSTDGAGVYSVSCASAGNCSAGGDYSLTEKRSQAFVVNETVGKWGKAQAVPGFTSRDAGENTLVYAISCPTAGNCGAGGSYSDGSNKTLVFLMSERNGKWGRALEVPGSAHLDEGGSAIITSISCASVGDCSAGGVLPGPASSTDSGAFVVNETNGKWGNALELTGPPAFREGGAGIDSISCASPGLCSAGGSYKSGLHGSSSFVVNEENGKWGRAREVPGLAVLNLGGGSDVRSVSCGAPSSCSAVGQYEEKSGLTRAFIVSEAGGVWGNAFDVPELSNFNGHGLSALVTISCASSSSCSTGGYYGNNHQIAFVDNEVNGKWSKAMAIPGLTSLDVSHDSYVESISCASAGNCGATGSYSGKSSIAKTFFVNETNGTWGAATTMHGLQSLDANSSEVNSISCTTPESCSAGGEYSGRNHNGALVVSTKFHNH
jgi:hypothetical protein